MTFTPDPEMIARARNPARGPDGRLRSIRDAVERSIFRPHWAAATGAHREEIVRRRDLAVAELSAADEDLAALISRRRDLVDRIRACNLAITGTGEVRDRSTGETLQVLGNWRKRIPFDDPQPPVPDGAAHLSAGRLRAATVELLQAMDGPLSPTEIERLLRLQHLVPHGRPSQAIVNALRPAVRRGEVIVVERGWYEVAR